MSAILRPIRSYPLVAFTILACLLGWLPYILAAFGLDENPGNMPLGPVVAAAIVAACLGRAGLKEWGRRLASFRAAPAWYVLAAVAPVAILGVAVLANAGFGAPLPTSAQLATWTELPGTFVFFVILVGIGEEAGWTAFAAPRLLARHTFVNAWLILSAIRVFWHLPLMLTGDLPWVLGLGGNIAFQFLVLWLLRRSAGCWVLAALWHSVLNTFGGEFFFRMVQGPDQARLGVLMTAGYVLAAAAVYLFDRPALDRAVEAVQPQT